MAVFLVRNLIAIRITPCDITEAPKTIPASRGNGAPFPRSVHFSLRQNGSTLLVGVLPQTPSDGLHSRPSCPPSNTILTKSAFLISDFYIIPLIRDNISIKGVEHYISTVNEIYSWFCEDHDDADFYNYIFKGKPKLLGLFECMRIRNELARGRGSLANLKKYKVY